jgi:hypothetical protein
LITIRSSGRTKPELTIARSTRCVLSLTAASGSTTSTVFGSAPGETSTSTSTGSASIPNSENVRSLASMRRRRGEKVKGSNGVIVVNGTSDDKQNAETNLWYNAIACDRLDHGLEVRS